jgi:hypothetical protein
VRMVLGAFMLMNVLKGRLQERQRQHEVHKNGNAGSHRHILSTYHSSVRVFFVRCTFGYRHQFGRITLNYAKWLYNQDLGSRQIAFNFPYLS